MLERRLNPGQGVRTRPSRAAAKRRLVYLSQTITQLRERERERVGASESEPSYAPILMSRFSFLRLELARKFQVQGCQESSHTPRQPPLPRPPSQTWASSFVCLGCVSAHCSLRGRLSSPLPAAILSASLAPLSLVQSHSLPVSFCVCASFPTQCRPWQYPFDLEAHNFHTQNFIDLPAGRRRLVLAPSNPLCLALSRSLCVCLERVKET